MYRFFFLSKRIRTHDILTAYSVYIYFHFRYFRYTIKTFENVSEH